MFAERVLSSIARNGESAGRIVTALPECSLKISSNSHRAVVSQEWQLLLEAARPDCDAQRFSNLAAGPLDWAALLRLAERHRLLPLLALKLKNLAGVPIPPEICRQIQEKNRAYGLFALSLSGELFRLLEHFSVAQIQTVVIKGPVLSIRCYGDPALRQYTDLDLIVRAKDIQRSTEIMLGLGYEPSIPLHAVTSGKGPGEYVFRRPGTNLLIEFHTESTFRYHPRALPIEKVMARKAWVSIDGRQVPALTLEDELVLICIHAAKHLWERLAWVADVAALLTNNPDLDWQNAKSAAEEVGAERMLRVGLWLATNVLAASLPVKAEAYVNCDTGAVNLAKRIAANLEQGRASAEGILHRAAFRVKMRGGFLPGLAYLVRLSFSPTEDDWSGESVTNRPWVLDAIARPFRLARKYHRGIGE